MKRLIGIAFIFSVLTFEAFALPANADFPSRAFIGSVAEIKFALENGNDVNEDIGGGMTPLLAASSMNSIAAIRLLVSVGANVNDQERQYGLNALMFAIQRDDPAIIEFLIDSGADPFIKDYSGEDVLFKIDNSNYEKIKKSKIYEKIISMKR